MISQPEFDRIALFIAVASELRSEPFLCADNHETLSPFRSSTSEASDVIAHFCHPAFLKSAILPFRRLWLKSEKCAFEKVHPLVFQHHHDQNGVSAYRDFIDNLYTTTLDQPVDKDWAKDSVRDILNIWIYTQALHAGQRENSIGLTLNMKDPKLEDFDRKARNIGREKFEFLFRTSIRMVGGIYVEFLNRFAEPMYWKLIKDGMAPGFEAKAALEFNPYPDHRYNITFDDVFWHLDKESIEETFDRLLVRQSYGVLQSLFRGLFATRAAALTAICRDATLEVMLQTNKVVLLQNQQVATGYPIAAFSGLSALPLVRAIRVQVYQDKSVRFEQNCFSLCADIYCDFRNALFAERDRQRRIPSRTW